MDNGLESLQTLLELANWAFVDGNHYIGYIHDFEGSQRLILHYTLAHYKKMGTVEKDSIFHIKSYPFTRRSSIKRAITNIKLILSKIVGEPPREMEIIASPPHSKPQNFHLDCTDQLVAATIPLTPDSTSTEFLNYIGKDFNSLEPADLEKFVKFIYGIEITDSNIIRIVQTLGDILFFNTSHRHRGPGNPNTDWRFVLFCAWGKHTDAYSDEHVIFSYDDHKLSLKQKRKRFDPTNINSSKKRTKN